MRNITLPISFLIFILLIITLANLGFGPKLWGFINDIPQGDKIGHFILYGLTVLSIESFWGFKKLGLGTIITIIFVIIEEVSQNFISSRTFSLLDLFWSFAGIAVFEILMILNLLKSKNQS